MPEEEEKLIKLCRSCGKKGYTFCNIHHEVVQKLLRFIPSLVSYSIHLIDNINKTFSFRLMWETESSRQASASTVIQ